MPLKTHSGPTILPTMCHIAVCTLTACILSSEKSKESQHLMNIYNVPGTILRSLPTLADLILTLGLFIFHFIGEETDNILQMNNLRQPGSKAHSKAPHVKCWHPLSILRASAPALLCLFTTWKPVKFC